jgi:integrase
MTKKKARREIARFGRRGEFVRVFVETGAELVRVQWKVRGSSRLGTESWPNTPENRTSAIAWAEGKYSALAGGDAERGELISLLTLWERFAESEFPHLRPKTRDLYRTYFRMWLKTWGEPFPAERTTLAMVAKFRAEMTKLGRGVTMVGKAIQAVKTVYAWGERQELLSRNRVRLYRYKVAKESRPVGPSEYRLDECRRILDALSPRDANQWRAWAALTLCGMQGTRENAVLHLKVEDVTLGHTRVTAAGAVTWAMGSLQWRPEWDKQGNDWTQPLRFRSQMAIEVALEWRERLGDDGPWLFPPHRAGSRRETYSAQTLIYHLHNAERRAGITPEKGRGPHSFRRMLAGDVAEATGNPVLALQAIGDTDLRQANRYLKKRTDQVQGAFQQLDDAAELVDAGGEG